MKVVVLNYTGTVGKTTTTVHLLSPRMKDAPIFAIESINQSADDLGVDAEKLRGDQFRILFTKLLSEDNAIVDVGASNVESFMQSLELFEQSHEEFDLFILPVTPGTKEQQETIAMVNSLIALGIPGDKIRILFNRVQRDIQSEFPLLNGYHAHHPTFWLNPACAIGESELFDALSLHKVSIEGLLNDGVDYKHLLKNKDLPPAERGRLSDLFGLKLQAKNIQRKLDNTFALLVGEGATCDE